VKEKYQAIGGLQNVIATVDGTFIPIKASTEDHQSFFKK
jgi:hypothetical protein